MFGKDLAATEEQVLPPCFRNQYPRFGDIPFLEETHNPIDESPKNRVHLYIKIEMWTNNSFNPNRVHHAHTRSTTEYTRSKTMNYGAPRSTLVSS